MGRKGQTRRTEESRRRLAQRCERAGLPESRKPRCEREGAARSPKPARYVPGSAEALEILARRAERGEALTSPEDELRPGGAYLRWRTGGNGVPTHAGAVAGGEGLCAIANSSLGRFGKSLRRLREGRGLSLGQVELDTGLSRSYLSELERGLKLPGLGPLLVLARFYRLDAAGFADLAGYGGAA